MTRRFVFSLIVWLGIAGATVGYVIISQQDVTKAIAPPLQGEIEPKKIEGSLDTWYKVMQGNQHVGYAHVRLLRQAFVPWAFSITSEQEAEIQLEDDYIQFSSYSDGHLEENFNLLDLSGKVTVQGITIELRYNREGNERTIMVAVPGQEPVTVPAGDENVRIDLALAVFNLMQTNKIKAKERIIVPMLDFSGGRPQSRPVQLLVNEAVKREYIGATSAVYPIDVEGVPSPVDDFRVSRIYIDGYGRMVEVETFGEVRLVIAKDSKAAKGNRDVPTLGRRGDPFDKSRAMGGVRAEEEDPKKKAKEEVSIEAGKEEQFLRKAEELLNQMKQMKNEGLQEKLRETYVKFIELYQPLRDKLLQKPNLLSRLDSLKGEAEKYYPGAEVVLQEAEVYFAAIGRAAEREECDEIGKQLEKLEALRDRPELINSPLLRRLEVDLIQEAKKLLDVCRIREELRNKKLIVTGTVHYDRQVREPVELKLDVLGHRLNVSHTVVLVHSEKYAVINNDVYHVGEVVEGEGVRVEKIDKFGVEVSYKGQTRPVPIR